MQIQVNTGDNVEGREELIARVEAGVAAALSRFDDRLTRVEVHLGDENAGKSGAADKRCMIEARPAGSARAAGRSPRTRRTSRRAPGPRAATPPPQGGRPCSTDPT